MGIIIRQSIKSTSITYIGVIIGMFNVLFLCSKYLSTEQFGLYVSLTTIPLFLSGFAQLGLANTLVRFFHKFEDKEAKNNGVLALTLLITSLGLFLLLLVYLLFKTQIESIYLSNSPLIIVYAIPILLLSIFSTYSYILEAYCRANLRIVFPSIIREVLLKIGNSILIICFGLNILSFDSFIIGLVISGFVGLILLVFYIKYLDKFFLNLNLNFLDRQSILEILKYNTGTFFSGFSGMLIVNIEKLFLPAYKGGLVSTALFDIGSKFGLIISIPKNSISMISSPILAKAWANEDNFEIQNIYKKSALNMFIAGLFIFLCILTNIDTMLQIMPNGEIYKNAKYVFVFIGLGRIVDMATGLNSEIIQNSKYYYYDFVFTIILSLLLIVSNQILIPLYSYNGAAIASLFSIIIANSLKAVLIYRKFKIHFLTKETAKVIFIGAFVYSVFLFLPYFTSSISSQIFELIVRCILLSGIFWFPILFFKISEDFNLIFKKLMSFVK